MTRVLSAARRHTVLAAVCAASFAWGCKPNIEGRPSLIDRTRVIAVQSTPAEQKPGDETGVAYRALLASPDDAASADDLGWAYCMIRKPIAVIGPASLDCYAPAGKGLEQLGVGQDAHGVIDKDDCSVFGPSPPMQKDGEPAARPADPDTTGGYYQPVRVRLPGGSDGDDDYVVGVTRLACGLAGATQDQSIDFADRYRSNENPAVDEIDVKYADRHEDALKVTTDMPSITVRPREHITLSTTWADCPTDSTCGDGICGAGEYPMDRMVMGMPVTGCPDDCTAPKGCTGSEAYVALDPLARRVVSHREAMRVSWFATDGSFDHDRTGRTEEEARDGVSENDWVAPSAKGRVHMWFVLRDDRGGVGWTELSVDVGS